MGIDIVENARIKKILVKNKSSFEKRVFTKTEISYCKSRNDIVNCYSKRFAAKEAFAKALGIGFTEKINFIDIEIKKNKLGKPNFFTSKKLNSKIKSLYKVKKFNVYLSISDEKKYSIANVIISK